MARSGDRHSGPEGRCIAFLAPNLARCPKSENWGVGAQTTVFLPKAFHFLFLGVESGVGVGTLQEEAARL